MLTVNLHFLVLSFCVCVCLIPVFVHKNYDASKIDGYFSSQPVAAIQRTLEITAGFIEIWLLGFFRKTKRDEEAENEPLTAAEIAQNAAQPVTALHAMFKNGSVNSTESSSLGPDQLPNNGIRLDNLVLSARSERKRREEIERKEQEYELAVRFRRTLISLGPTFIKLGQALANRPDLIGLATAAELTQLQDRLPPFPYEEVCAIMEMELGKPPHLLFDSFSPVPVAAGSLGQVRF